MSQTAVGARATRSAKSDIETSTIRAISWRLIPFLVLAYFLAYLDRVNLGFAALTMNAELNFSPTVFAWGAGIFFIGYFIFEVPSNIALEKFGASRWIARIMVSWGIISVLLGIVTWFYLTDKPAKADWLTPDQKMWLADKLESERMVKESAHGM